MNVKPRSESRAAKADDRSEYALYAQVAEVVTKALQAGREPDLEQLISQHPEHAEHIDQLVSTLTMLHEVDQWRGGESTDGSSAPDPRAALGRIGDYRLLREVGRGGMGVVYEAQQLSLSRKVALKVLPFAAVLDQRQLQRFKNEAQAAAQLHHTHIVPVFGVGCERGVHYYAMQYIEGLTLREVITELRRSSGLPGDVGAASTLSRAAKPPISNGLLDVREPAKAASSNAARLGASAPVGAGSSAAVAALASEQSTRSPAFFRAVAQMAKDAAEALEHAHEVGIVHRDIKPGNLIVDSRGHVWVTDFGLARVESDPGLTMTGDIVGTVRYMSPEQALAKRVPIDHRTDIYSLGATLYELLTLQPVFAGKDRQELLRQIAFDEPRSPRKINPFIPRELETIVLTAIRKNPVERYESARTLADDLGRFLEYKPILAKPPSLADRASKWCRRHTTVVGSLAALLVTAVVALSISTALIWREKDRTQNALTQARDNFSLAEEQRERAEANFLLARESVDQMLTRVAEQLKDQPHTEQLRRELLEDALAFYERFLANENSSPDVRHDTGNALRRVASINSWLGDRTKAEVAYHRSVDTLEKLAEEYPDQPEYRSSLATSYQCFGNFVAGPEKYEEAASFCRDALGIVERLVETYPEKAEYRSQLAGLLNDMGIRLSEMDEDEDAERHYRRSLALWEALASEYPAEAEYRKELARIHNNLGVLLDNKGNYLGKEQAYRDAIAIMDELIADHPTEPGYRSSQALYLNNLVHTLRNRGQLDEAEETFPQALELYQDLAADFPKAPGYRSWVRKVQLQWAPALIDAGRREDALAAYRKAARVEQSLIEDFPNQTQYRVSLIVIYRCIAEVLANGQEHDEARKVAQDAVDMARELVAAHSDENKYREQLAGSQLTLANVLKKSGDHDAAEAAYQQALSAVVDLIDRDPDEPRYRSVQWHCYRLIGDLQTVMKHTADAESAFRTAVSLGDEDFKRFGAEGHKYYGGWSSNYDSLIRLLTDTGRPTEAKQLGEQRIAVLQQLVKDRPQTHEFRVHLAWAYQSCANWHESSGRYSDAEQLLHQGVQALETLATQVPEDEDVRWQLSAYTIRFGDFLFRRERYAEAETFFRRSVELRNGLAGDFPHKSYYRARGAYAMRRLGETQLKIDRPADAEESLRESIHVGSTLVSESPEDINYVDELVQANFELSDLLRKAGRHDEAHDQLQAAMNTLDNLPADTKDRRQRDLMVNTLHRVAGALKGAGEHTEAVEILERAIGICESLVADFPAGEGFRNNLAALLDSKASNLAEAGKHADAEMAYRTAIEIYTKLVADYPQRTDYVNWLRNTHVHLADMLTDLDRESEARIEHQKAVALRGELVGQMVGLAKQSADGVAQAVAQVLAIDLANESKPFVLLMCGDFLTLGGYPQRAVDAIQRAIDAGGYEHWYYKSLGWALAGAGQPEEADAAFAQALAKFDTWSPHPPEQADIDHWTAAYFLDRVTQEQYTERWRSDEEHKERFACFPWFYVGQRAEIEDRIEDAIAAYETAVELGKLPNAHYVTNYAAYRLQILTGKRVSVADDPNATQLVEEP